MTSLKVLKSKYKEESNSKKTFDQAVDELKNMVLKNYSAKQK